MWHVFVSGAINARTPNRTVPQVHFKKDYSGGRGEWRHVKNTCKPYDGPELAWFLRGCKASDGSYWALQMWQRMLPNVGYVPWTHGQRVWEVHISHWTGATAQARRVHRLGLRRPFPRGLRPGDVSRQAGLRLPHDEVGQPARHVRAPHLRRHLRLGVRRRLAPRELVRRAQPERHVLLRLLPLLELRELPAPALDEGCGQRQEVPADALRARRDAGRLGVRERPAELRLAEPHALRLGRRR